jgi:hypothetical protein
MNKRLACLLVVVFVALGASGSRLHVVKGVSTVPYLADGGGPTPPPIPMHGSGKSVVTYVADGGGPTPPPIPMHRLNVSC